MPEANAPVYGARLGSNQLPTSALFLRDAPTRHKDCIVKYRETAQ